MNRNITENVKTPRALHVRFPYGAPLGPAAHPATQQAVIEEALHVLMSARLPGSIVTSSVEWPE
jgi:D-proline reductase (dithiol) PrdB